MAPAIRARWSLPVLVAALGCAPVAVSPPSAPPAPPPPPPLIAAPGPAVPEPVPGLPPVPAVVGAPLQLTVRYPEPGQLLAVRDSTFLLGSVGSGDVTLSINGAPVPVAPNGAFLAWLPVPVGEAPGYQLTAVRGADTVRQALPVRLPAHARLAPGALVVDPGALTPEAGTWARPDRYLRVTVRAAERATVELQGRRERELVRVPLRPLGAPVDGLVTYATDVLAAVLGDSTSPARVLVRAGRDSVRLPVAAVRLLPTTWRQLATLAPAAAGDTDRAVFGRTIADGTYKWLLLPRTTLEVTGRQGGFTRLRLDALLDVWVANGDVQLLPEGTALPRRVTGGMRVLPAREWADLVIGTGEPPAHLVEAEGRTLTLTLYGVQMNPEISPLLEDDTLVRRVAWEQVGSDRVRVVLTLSQPVYGWLALWDRARRAFVLRVRRPPRIDPARPLAGLRIAVDPGHPPAGATGPTGLYEGDAVLPVGGLVAELLAARGATPVLTRRTREAVGLTARAVLARRADVHAFVSIHLNALPDGVNPFTATGTSTLFFHQPSEPLARHVQRAMVARFGVRDLGVHYQNLAVARPSWYPAVLAEGLFLMVPEQEAAMRDPGFQRRYAEALVAGVEAYFREWAR
jgi:N-acetylmuramoyl-L-alanine amidase